MAPFFENVQDYPLLSAEECARVAATIHELRPHWMQRRPGLPFYTLGVASYLDAQKESARCYHAPASHLNPLLLAHFGWLYDRLTSHLVQLLGGEVVYRPSCGRPGFHIFQWCPPFENYEASIHQDLQYQFLDWKPEEQPDFRRPLSFTLAITLPGNGGGLNVFDVGQEELEPLPEDQYSRRIAAATKEYHPYQVGHLAVHSGHRVHQIATGRKGRDGDERVTLQGHGIHCDGVWQLYW